MITNKINNKKYVGLTTKTGHEFKSYWGSGELIKAAIRKYGIDNFEKTILEVCKTHQELVEAEIKWIKESNSVVPYGYNIHCGGNSGQFGIYDDKNDVDKYKRRAMKIWESRRKNGTHIKTPEQLERSRIVNKRISQSEVWKMKIKHHNTVNPPKELRYYIWNMLTGELVDLVNIRGVKDYIYQYNEKMGYKNNKRCNHHLLCHLGHTRDFLMIKKESAHYAKK